MFLRSLETCFVPVCGRHHSEHSVFRFAPENLADSCLAWDISEQIWPHEISVVGAELARERESRVSTEVLHCAKGGAVETGCSGLHEFIGCFIT